MMDDDRQIACIHQYYGISIFVAQYAGLGHRLPQAGTTAARIAWPSAWQKQRHGMRALAACWRRPWRSGNKQKQSQALGGRWPADLAATGALTPSKERLYRTRDQKSSPCMGSMLRLEAVLADGWRERTWADGMPGQDPTLPYLLPCNRRERTRAQGGPDMAGRYRTNPDPYPAKAGRAHLG